jgi:glycolate oxidase FAD binding subunit
VLATNLSGPRRIKAGAARDHFLGVGAVSGRGEAFKSGGRVVKNVTGYDLCKVLAGSFGTLAAMTEATIKVLPAPETEATVLLTGLDDVAASRAMSAAMASSCDVSAAAHLPRDVAARLPALSGSSAATLFRLEGVRPSVEHRKETLRKLLKAFGAVEQLDSGQSHLFWLGVRDAIPFAAENQWGGWPLWRISTAPTRGVEFAARLPREAQFFYDWAGGLVWAAMPPSDDAGAGFVCAAAAVTGGHATLVRAPAAVRAAIDVFQRQDGPLAAVTRRVKESFDPKGVLNPGRMWAGV